MAINKKLIHFQKKADFDTQLAARNILDTSIVFIKDAKQIYTHGQLYNCPYTEEQLLNLLNSKANTTDLTDTLTQANKYTDNKISNLVGQAPEALDTVYELAEAMATNQDAVDVLNEAIGKKVDKVTGKDLSTNDYTTAEKNKLAGIAQGATANLGTITGIKMNGASRGSAGVVDLGTVITEHQDISGKLDSEVANATYLKKTDAANTYQPIGDYATKSEIPTKVSELQNDANYIQDDSVSDGVYAVDASGKLIDYNLADATAIGVALVAGEHRFMIAKSDATDGTNTTLYYDYDKGDLSLTNYSKADGTNSYGYLGTELSDDFTTWTEGALSDFNGKTNTQVIAASSSNARDMCKVLETFNAGSDNQGHSDWYVPACGQLALMYLAKTDINAALDKIGGTALESDFYWSSSEGGGYFAWYVFFNNGYVSNYDKDYSYRVRFIRDISLSKSLKERVYELEELNAILVDTDDVVDDPITNDFVTSAQLETKQDKITDLDAIRSGAAKGATALQSYTEQYKGTVTSITTGKGLTGGTITGSGTIKCNLNSEASLGTIGTTSKLYAVGVDANNKLCVNVPWTSNSDNTTYAMQGQLQGNSYMLIFIPSDSVAEYITIPAMTAATSSAAGTAGLVPAPGKGKQNSFLRGDGTWVAPSDTKVTQTVTTTNANYPLLFAPSGQTANTTTTSYFNTGIYANASTKSLYATNFYSTSDKQFKTNIESIITSDNCPKVRQFDWKDNGTHSYGFIAQELEEQGYKELVSTNEEDGSKTVNYSATLSLVVGKMQAKIEELEKKISELEDKLTNKN